MDRILTKLAARIWTDPEYRKMLKAKFIKLYGRAPTRSELGAFHRRLTAGMEDIKTEKVPAKARKRIIREILRKRLSR